MIWIHLIQLLTRKRRVERTLGIVADYCPFCHAPRAFKIKRIAMKEALSTSDGKTLEHQIECPVCRAKFSTNPLGYERFSPKNSRVHDLQMLIQDTHPQLWQTHSSALAFDRLLRASPEAIPPESRASHMLGLFNILEPTVRYCYKRGWHFDRVATFWGVTTVVLFFAAIIASSSAFAPSHWGDTALEAAGLVFVVGGLVTLVELIRVPGRAFRNQLLPRLARSLAPFHPMREELEALVLKCKTSGLVIGKKTKVKRLIVELEKVPADTAADETAYALQPPQNPSPHTAAPTQAANDRGKLIIAPFHMVNPLIEDYYARGIQFDKPSTLGCLGTILIGGGLFALALTIYENTPWEERVALAAGALVTIGICYTIVQLALAPGRHVKKVALPRLLHALRPLDPTEAEITRTLEKCKMAGMIIGKKLKPVQLMAALRNVPAGFH